MHRVAYLTEIDRKKKKRECSQYLRCCSCKCMFSLLVKGGRFDTPPNGLEKHILLKDRYRMFFTAQILLSCFLMKPRMQLIL